MKRTLTALVSICAVITPVYAAEFWAKKPYQDWSLIECHKMLWDSPWGRSYSIQKTVMRELNRDPFNQRSFPNSPQTTVLPPGTATTESGPITESPMPKAQPDQNQEGALNPRITYHASFRSAKPVREAFVRLSRLDAKYDQMDDAHKKQVEAGQQKFLAATFPDKIIVHVSYESSVIETDRALAFYWQSQTLDTLKNTVFLSGPQGHRIEPAEYYVGKGALREFQFAFPRKSQQDADPSQPLIFEFRHPALGTEPGERIFLKYPSVADMKFEGDITY